MLALSCLEGARVVAGSRGLDRRVSRLNVMEVPDVAAWVKPDELLLTTGYPLHQRPDDAWVQLVSDLADAGLAGVAVKLGRYVDYLPPDMLIEADRRGLPVIELPSDLAFDEVINQVLEAVLDNRAAVLSRTDAAHRALVEIVLAGGDLRLLADGLVRFLGGAVLITALNGEALAGAGDPDLVARVASLPCFDDEGRFHAARVRAGELGPGGPWLACERIAAGGTGHGHLVLISGDRELIQEDLNVLERAATVAALAITKAEAVTAVESKYRSDFLRDVLTGRGGSTQRMVSHAQSLGWDLARRLVVVVGELDPVEEDALAAADVRDLDARLTRAWTRAVEMVDSAAPAAGFRDRVVALVPVPAEADHVAVTKHIRRFVATVQNDRSASLLVTLSVGISRTVTRVEDLPTAYEHAHRAMSVGRKVHGVGNVTAFDALGVFRLLALVEDTDELTAFAEDTLGPLLTLAAAESQDLLRTVAVLLDTGMNVAESARLLHFHYNTLRYRINKIETLLGPFTTDAQLRLRVTLALQVREMHGL